MHTGRQEAVLMDCIFKSLISRQYLIYSSLNWSGATFSILKDFTFLEQSEGSVFDNDFIYINHIKNGKEDFKARFKNLNADIPEWIVSLFAVNVESANLDWRIYWIDFRYWNEVHVHI